MSARGDLYAALMRGKEQSPDNSERASFLIDAALVEHAHELAEALGFHENPSLFDAVNNVMLEYGFFNPKNSVPFTSRVFQIFRDHIDPEVGE